MSKTRTFSANWRWATVAIVLLLLAGLSLAGCGGEPTAAPTEVAAEPTPTTAPTEAPPTEEPTEVPPTATPTQVPPTATPTEEPTPEVVDNSACVTCHTDQETLQALAVEPEAPEVESEGEG